MAWILPRLSNYQQVAPLVRTGGSRHTGLAAPPRRNIQRFSITRTDDGKCPGILNSIKMNILVREYCCSGGTGLFRIFWYKV